MTRKQNSRRPVRTPHTTQPLLATFDKANDALADLQILECVLCAATDDSTTLDAPTRQAALVRAAEQLHTHIAILEQTLDVLEDHTATHPGSEN